MIIKIGYARFSLLLSFVLLGTVQCQEVSFKSVGALRLRAFGLDAITEDVTAKESADAKSAFGYLGSAMNISDDIARGKSHFKSEVDRADMLSHNINKLNKANFGLVVVDELFTGASAQANAEAEYKVICNWATSDYLCFVAATHFKDALTQLEAETQGIVKNYKMDAFKDQNGTIYRPFKIESGISDCNIATDLFNAQMADL